MINAPHLSTECVKASCYFHHCLLLPTSGYARIETETCLEQRTKSCGQLNLADAEHVKHCVHLRDKLYLSSNELLQQFPQERKVVQSEVDSMCN